MATIKQPIKLLFRERTKGVKSIFLNIYDRGKRKQESLNLYLYPETSREIKEQNRQTLARAEAIKAQRLVDYHNRRYNLNEASIASPYVIDYYSALMQRKSKQLTEGTLATWNSALNHLKLYAEGDTLDMVDKEWCTGLIDYLNKARLSVNAARTYMAKVNAMLHQAVKDGLIMRNPMNTVVLPKKTDTHREALSIEELRIVAATPCKLENAKRAFLFSCLTGMRMGDVLSIKWGDVREVGEFTRIVFVQQKTKHQEYLDISPQAVQYLGARGKDKDRVFSLSKTQCVYGLNRLMKEAGITRDITFHCGRHTFAVLMLSLGADIYTVKNLLGHQNIGTTQIYAKMLDKRKQEAVLRIPEI